LYHLRRMHKMVDDLANLISDKEDDLYDEEDDVII
jgi:hypothetical protein